MKAQPPVRLLATAAMMVAGFTATHLAGLRESTSFLSRIDVAWAPGWWTLFGLGLYLVTYVGCVLVAPILVLAAAGHVVSVWAVSAARERKDPAARGIRTV